MNVGKCPVCHQLVEKAIVEIVQPDGGQSKIFGGMPRGLAFVCPNPKCHTILGIIESK